MNALALYRLTSLPEQQKSVDKQPLKKQRIAEPTLQSIQYLCKFCKKPVFLSSDDIVQCHTCQSRIVNKIASSEKKTYQAV